MKFFFLKRRSAMFGFWALTCAYRLFETVREPSVPQNRDHWSRRTFQIFKRIHEDKVQHNVKEAHTDHLEQSQRSNREPGSQEESVLLTYYRIYSYFKLAELLTFCTSTSAYLFRSLMGRGVCSQRNDITTKMMRKMLFWCCETILKDMHESCWHVCQMQ